MATIAAMATASKMVKPADLFATGPRRQTVFGFPGVNAEAGVSRSAIRLECAKGRGGYCWAEPVVDGVRLWKLAVEENETRMPLTLKATVGLTCAPFVT